MSEPVQEGTGAAADDDDEVITIGEEHLDRRVDLEQGMSALPIVSILLILLCTAVYALQLVHGGDPEQVEHWVSIGAKDAASIQRGEVWRLVSPALLHGGVDHLIGNAIALYVLGVACEHAFGRVRTLSIFVATAVAASLLSCLDPRPSVGASGAVFGLMGAVATAVIVRRGDLHVRDKRVGVVLFLWAAWSLGTGALDPMIDNVGHLGGFVMGCALGVFTRVVIIPWRPAGHPVPAAVAGVASALALAWALLAVLARLVS